MSATGLRALTSEQATAEALRFRLRQEALAEFRAGYPRAESRRAMVGALTRVVTTFTKGQHTLTTFPWETVDRRLAGQMLVSIVSAGYARRTVTKDASAVRVMLDCCRHVGMIDAEACRTAQSFEVKGGVELPQPGHFISENDLVKIIQTCERGSGSAAIRIRDVALLTSLASSGARGDELTRVELDDVHLDEQRIWLRWTKSGKPRDAWLHPTAVAAIERWLRVRGTTSGPLFVPMSRVRPLLDHGRLSTHQAWKIVQHRAHDAGFEHITPTTCGGS